MQTQASKGVGPITPRRENSSRTSSGGVKTPDYSLYKPQSGGNTQLGHGFGSPGASRTSSQSRSASSPIGNSGKDAEAHAPTPQQTAGNCWERAATTAAGRSDLPEGALVKNQNKMQSGGTDSDIKTVMERAGMKDVRIREGITGQDIFEELQKGRDLVATTQPTGGTDEGHAFCVKMDSQGQMFIHDSGPGETRQVTADELTSMGLRSMISGEKPQLEAQAEAA